MAKKKATPPKKPEKTSSFGLMPGSFRFLNRGWLIAILVLGFIGLFSLASFTTYIRPSELGILRIRFGWNKGIQKKVYHAGRYLVLPGWETMYRFPKSLQLVHWNKNYNREQSRQGYRWIPPIRIQTSEGSNVQTDVTILYRLKDPYKVMTTIGPGMIYEDSALIPRAEKILRLVLGELNAEEFYRGPKRISKAQEVRRRLNKDLADKGIEIINVLVMEFQYDRRYQRMIESRKLQDQRVFLQQAEKLATIQRNKKRVIVEKGKARVQRELARGEKEVAQVLATASLYQRKRRAQGYLLQKLAEAHGIELKNRALEGAGSQYLVAMKMAELLAGIELLVLPSNGKQGLNPLNILKTLNQLDVKPAKPSTRPKRAHHQFQLPEMKPPKIGKTFLQRSNRSNSLQRSATNPPPQPSVPKAKQTDTRSRQRTVPSQGPPRKAASPRLPAAPRAILKSKPATSQPTSTK